MIERLEPAIAREFLRAIAEVRAQASIEVIARLLEAGEVDAAATALGLNEARFAELTERVREAYLAGGRQGVKELPVLRSDPTALGALPGAMRVHVNFNMRNERAERWLAEHSSRLVTEIVTDQREMIRAMLTANMQLGRNPRQTALDIVGRMGRSGRRTGGVVGLTSQQGRFVANLRAELSDPASMAGYFNRKRRDRRFDSLVRRAMAAGEPVAAADIDKIAGRYADRLLNLRGEVIARTESLAAFSEARDEAFRQAADTGAVKPENVRKVWSAVGDSRTREAHAEMNGMEVGLNDPFQSPTGARLLHPGDTSMGAGAADIINCRCQVTYVVRQIEQAMEAA